MPDIAALYTNHYDETEVYRQVSALLDALHVPDDVKPGMKVVLKLNLLTGRAPEYCVTTHPSVVRAVALYLREHGITDITAADSPGGPFTVEALTSIYKACRMLPLEEEGLLKLNRDVSWKTVKPSPDLRHCGCQLRDQPGQDENPRYGPLYLRDQEPVRNHPRASEAGNALPLPQP